MCASGGTASPHSHFLRTAKAELKVKWAWWVPRWASRREPASGPWPAAISSAAAFSTSQPPSCWWVSMWELSRGYRAEETQPTKRPASRSSDRSSSSQVEADSCRKVNKLDKREEETKFSKLFSGDNTADLLNTYTWKDAAKKRTFCISSSKLYIHFCNVVKDGVMMKDLLFICHSNSFVFVLFRNCR